MHDFYSDTKTKPTRAMREVVLTAEVTTRSLCERVAEDDGSDAAWLVSAMRRDGVLIGAFGGRRLRIVTHLDVDEAGGDALCASMRRHLTAKRMSAE